MIERHLNLKSHDFNHVGTNQIASIPHSIQDGVLLQGFSHVIINCHCDYYMVQTNGWFELLRSV